MTSCGVTPARRNVARESSGLKIATESTKQLTLYATYSIVSFSAAWIELLQGRNA
jgi:hypothetical protein